MDIPIIQAFFSIFLVFIILFSIFGNCLVLLLIIKNKGMRTRTNCFICCLAIGDFLKAVINMPISLGILIKGDFMFGNTVCNFSGFTHVFFLVFSIYVLMSMYIHKYITIVKPLSNWINSRRISCMILTSFLYSFLMATLSIFGLNRAIYKNSTFICEPDYPSFIHPERIVYSILFLITCLFLPPIIMIYCCIRIFAELKSSYWQTNLSKTDLIEQQRKIFIIFILIAIIFFSCWMPYFIFTFTAATVKNKQDFGERYRYWNLISLWLGYLQCCCNPIIYWVRNKLFRRGFLRLMCPSKLEQTGNINLMTV